MIGGANCGSDLIGVPEWQEESTKWIRRTLQGCLGRMAGTEGRVERQLNLKVSNKATYIHLSGQHQARICNTEVLISP